MAVKNKSKDKVLAVVVFGSITIGMPIGVWIETGWFTGLSVFILAVLALMNLHEDDPEKMRERYLKNWDNDKPVQ